MVLWEGALVHQIALLLLAVQQTQDIGIDDRFQNILAVTARGVFDLVRL